MSRLASLPFLLVSIPHYPMLVLIDYVHFLVLSSSFEDHCESNGKINVLAGQDDARPMAEVGRRGRFSRGCGEAVHRVRGGAG